MFLLRTEDEVTKKINFIDTHIIPKKLDEYIKKFYALPNHISLPIAMGEYAVFPDVFLKPYPMVSEMIMDVLKMYYIEPFFKRITLDDRSSGEYRVYFLLYLDDNAVSLYQDFELMRTPEEEIACVISLDFAESILRRDAQGIELAEWNR